MFLMGYKMTNTPDSNLEDAKDHLLEAKDEIKSATQSKVAETTAAVGEKLKEGIDHIVEKVTKA
jgi:hypothetical protein